MQRGRGRTYVESRRVAAEDAREVELLHLLLEPARQAGVHARPAREHDVLVELSADIDRGILDRLEQHL